MRNNTSTFDRTLRALFLAPLLVVIGGVVGPGSAAAIVLYVIAGVMLLTAAVGFCPLYALFHVETRCSRTLPH